MIGGAVGVLFVLITAIVAVATNPKDAFYSYLVAFAYWCRDRLRVR